MRASESMLATLILVGCAGPATPVSQRSSGKGDNASSTPSAICSFYSSLRTNDNAALKLSFTLTPDQSKLELDANPTGEHNGLTKLDEVTASIASVTDGNASKLQLTSKGLRASVDEPLSSVNSFTAAGGSVAITMSCGTLTAGSTDLSQLVCSFYSSLHADGDPALGISFKNTPRGTLAELTAGAGDQSKVLERTSVTQSSDSKTLTLALGVSDLLLKVATPLPALNKGKDNGVLSIPLVCGSL